jgi:hypothetical protein
MWDPRVRPTYILSSLHPHRGRRSLRPPMSERKPPWVCAAVAPSPRASSTVRSAQASEREPPWACSAAAPPPDGRVGAAACVCRRPSAPTSEPEPSRACSIAGSPLHPRREPPRVGPAHGSCRGCAPPPLRPPTGEREPLRARVAAAALPRASSAICSAPAGAR